MAAFGSPFSYPAGLLEAAADPHYRRRMVTVSTHLMFQGAARPALDLYRSVFDDFAIDVITRHEDAGADQEGSGETVYVRFGGHRLIVFDSPVPHDFDFTPSMSLFVDFGSQNELDTAFARLSDGGTVMMPLGDHGFSRRFGWVRDRFGVSWQLNLPAAG